MNTKSKLSKKANSYLTHTYLNHGITLVALVITIVILIILAVVTFNLTFRENGIIEQVQKAKEHNNVATKVEKIQLATTTAYMQGRGEITTSRLIEALEKEGITINSDNLKGNGPWIYINDNEEEYIIETNAKVTKVKGIGASHIASDPNTYYNKYVDYTAPENSEASWKIFYADETNIYLISSDYVSKIPVAAKGSTMTQGDTMYKYYWLIGQPTDYSGSADIINTFGVGTKYGGSNGVLNIYHKWVNENVKSENINAKWAAYMLDTTIWNKIYKDNIYADYVVGAPTIEMFAYSYNQTHEGDDSQLNYQISTYGYLCGWSNKNGEEISYSNYLSGLKDSTETRRLKEGNVDNSLYCIDNKKAQEYFLSSPSGKWGDFIMTVDNSGNVSRTAYGLDYSQTGFRPIICLNSKCFLIENGDKYSLKLIDT